MALSGSLTEQLAELLSAHAGRPVEVEEAFPVGGGSINDAWRLETDAGRYFVKTNHADRYPSMFEAEADGLHRLRTAGPLHTPEVIAQGEDHDDTFLLMEWVEGGIKGDRYWDAMGRGLARMHQHTWSRFGLDRDNYIGSIRQENTPEAVWSTFFVRHRLEPMVKKARDRHRVDAGMAFRFERLFARLDHLFPNEPPALLHGDLWGGNCLCGSDGQPVLIDPAVYYGHREMDIAMSKLFGGFDASFYGAYISERPLEQGWEERVDLCNLYPLLVHVVLFGGGYAEAIEAILRRHT